MEPDSSKFSLPDVVDKLYKRKPEELNKNTCKIIAEYYDNPQDSYKIVQVAGTNGKGSVCVKIATLLEQLSKYCLDKGIKRPELTESKVEQDKTPFKTGLFVSPHLSSIRERIKKLKNAKRN